MDIQLSPVQLRAFASITWKRKAKNFDSAEDMLIAHFRDKGKKLIDIKDSLLIKRRLILGSTKRKPCLFLQENSYSLSQDPLLLELGKRPEILK